MEGYINEIKPDYGVALASYDKAIEIDVDNVFAYVGRGHVNRMLGTLDNAITDFTKAAELDQDKKVIQIYINLCNLEYSRSKYAEASKNCEIVTQQENADPVFLSGAYQTLAMVYISQRDYARARSNLITATTITPNDPNLFIAFAKLNIYEEKYTESEVHARKAIELSPVKATAYLALAQALYMQEKNQESIQTAEKGIMLVNNDVSLLAPNKPATERDLNYIIAHNYRELGDEENQEKYLKAGEEAFNKSQQ